MSDRRKKSLIRLNLYVQHIEGPISNLYLYRHTDLDFIPQINSEMLINIGLSIEYTHCVVERVVWDIRGLSLEGEEEPLIGNSIFLKSELQNPMTIKNFQKRFDVSTIDEFRRKLRSLGWFCELSDGPYF